VRGRKSKRETAALHGPIRVERGSRIEYLRGRMALSFSNYRGEEILPHIPALGSLRISVFREFPYLYDGDEGYEREYLTTYARAAGSFVSLVRDGDEVVGATTCLPLTEAEEAFRRPFEQGGWDPATICYFGESILLPAHRGKGVGREFFVRREAHARQLGLPVTTFCAVDRPADHPARPAGYRPLDLFWQALGYVRHPELRASLPWREVGQAEEVMNTLTFWVKG
jgi:GNAT superfamily N-acetyltransferase